MTYRHRRNVGDDQTGSLVKILRAEHGVQVPLGLVWFVGRKTERTAKRHFEVRSDLRGVLAGIQEGLSGDLVLWGPFKVRDAVLLDGREFPNIGTAGSTIGIQWLRSGTTAQILVLAALALGVPLLLLLLLLLLLGFLLVLLGSTILLIGLFAIL